MRFLSKQWIHRLAHRFGLAERRLGLHTLFGHRWLAWECEDPACGMLEEISHYYDCGCGEPMTRFIDAAGPPN
jgi:hypothetical protein